MTAALHHFLKIWEVLDDIWHGAKGREAAFFQKNLTEPLSIPPGSPFFTEAEAIFPSPGSSDHSPILINVGLQSHICKPPFDFLISGQTQMSLKDWFHKCGALMFWAIPNTEWAKNLNNWKQYSSPSTNQISATYTVDRMRQGISSFISRTNYMTRQAMKRYMFLNNMLCRS